MILPGREPISCQLGSYQARHTNFRTVPCGGGAQYGNNTPTLNSGGKALNDASWGCNGCDVVNSSNSDPNNQGEVDANRRHAASAAFHKKYMEIYPQVFIPRNWKYANRFAEVFNQEADTWCHGYGWDCLTNAQDASEAEANQHIITHLKFLSCMALGHGKGCLGKTGSSIGASAAAIFALTGGAGEGPGGGFRGEGSDGSLRGEGSGGGSKCSFSPDTPVLMAKGKTKPIGKIKPGDKVEAADPTTGEDKGSRMVQHVWINHDNDLLDVAINTGHGRTEIIHTTSNHPFYDATTHTWTPAGNLKPGDRLASVHHQPATVASVHTTPGAANRYNLTVQQLHTYYVLAGETPVLVHNCGPMDLNFNQIRQRIKNHVMVNHGDTAVTGTKFNPDLTEKDLFDGLVNRIGEGNATGRVNEGGNHEHILPWPGAGANGENSVRVWMTPKGELGSMWPI